MIHTPDANVLLLAPNILNSSSEVSGLPSHCRGQVSHSCLWLVWALQNALERLEFYLC